MAENNICQECKMPVIQGQYHPYAACLMFKACRNSEVVKQNLRGVRNHAIEYCAMVLDAADKNDTPSGLAEKIRGLKKI